MDSSPVRDESKSTESSTTTDTATSPVLVNNVNDCKSSSGEVVTEDNTPIISALVDVTSTKIDSKSHQDNTPSDKNGLKDADESKDSDNVDGAETNTAIESQHKKDDTERSENTTSTDQNIGGNVLETETAHNDNTTSSSLEAAIASSSSEEEEPSTTAASSSSEPTVPTDEFGRELSAYEVMRLERIRRNQAKLAQLGLEDSIQKQKKQQQQQQIEARRKAEAARKRAEEDQKQGDIEMRRNMSRRTKVKKVNYSDDHNFKHFKGAMNSKLSNAAGGNNGTNTNGDSRAITPNRRKEKPRHLQVPRFIYREFLAVESSKRQNLKSAKHNVRLAETEHRHTQKQLDIHHRKVERWKKKLERQKLQEQAEQDKKKILPAVQEVERRVWEISAGCKALRKEVREREGLQMKEERDMEEAIEKARERFPQAIKEMEHSLDSLLRERFAFLKDDESDSNNDGGGDGDGEQGALKGENKKNKAKKSTKADSTAEKESSSASATKESSPPITDDVLQVDIKTTNKPKRKKRARNVGGPVSQKFASSLQRKWLENDFAEAPSSNNYFVPQVGDTVLYYPAIHHQFLQGHPDIRCSKSRLLLRKPLWKRAEDDQTEINQADDKETKKELQAKQWWTKEWMQSVDGEAGYYPILCRVDQIISEFPYDKEDASAIKKRKSKKGKEEDPMTKKENASPSRRASRRTGKEKDAKVEEVSASQNQSSRRSLRRKEQIGLSVTLRPLAPIKPPRKSTSKKKSAFEAESLCAPPLFSVLTFPSDSAQFLIPFSWAYHKSLSLSSGDNIKILGDATGRMNGSIESVNGGCVTDSTLEFFKEILHKNANVSDFSTTHQLDAFISECYANNKAMKDKDNCLLPEADLRAAIQAILFQHHKRKSCDNEVDTTTDNAPETAPPSAASKDKGSPPSISNLTKFIRMTLPLFQGVSVSTEGDKFKVSPWSIVPGESKTQSDKSQDDAYAAALAPSVILSSAGSNNGGLIYTMTEDLRAHIESGLKKYLATAEESNIFMQTITDKNVPGYSFYVPISMSVKKIMNRLKLRKMKFPKDQRHSSDNPTEQQAKENTCCSYYRHVSSILTDFSDLYHNCLLYNDPNSEIVLQAESFMSQAKAIIEKLESVWIRETKAKEKEERSVAQNAEMVARGMDNVATCQDVLASTTLDPENDILFEGELDRTWIEDTRPDGSFLYPQQPGTPNQSDTPNTQLEWSPQCGDKIFYNRQAHGRFVNTHFASLTKAQKTLPPLLPKKGRKLKNNASVSKLIDGETVDYWMLGTIQWVRAVFPARSVTRPDSKKKELETSTPLLAIGVQFHYNWLSDIRILYWRPSHVETNNSSHRSHKYERGASCTQNEDSYQTAENISTGNKPCDSSPDISFLRPAWKGSNEKVLPPFPMSLVRAHGPVGVPREAILSINNCFNAMQKRCTIGTPVDSFLPKELLSVMESSFDELPSQLKQMYDDKDKKVNDEISFSIETADDSSINSLCQVHFLPPWMSFGKKAIEKRKSTRNNSTTPTEQNSSFQPFHESVMPFTTLCLDLIKERLENGFYRSRLSISHDIREAFAASIHYYIMELIKSSRSVDEKSSRKILEHLFRSSMYFTTDNNTPKEENSSSTPQEESCDRVKETIGQLTKREKSIFERLVNIRKLYASALISVFETPTAELAFGLNKEVSRKRKFITDDRQRNYKYANAILSSLATDRSTMRTPVDKKTGTLPTIKVRVKFHGDKETDNDENPDIDLKDKISKVDFNQPLLIEPAIYEANTAIVSSILCMPNRKEVCLKCRINKQGLISCRLKKAHSNHDYSPWLKYLEQVGGVNGLMKLLIPSYSAPTHMGPIGFQTVHPTPSIIPPALQRDSEQEKSHHGTSSTQPESKVVIENSEDLENILKNLSERHEKAKLALKMAQEALVDLTAAADSPPRLSDEFIRNNFPVDPSDGHYEMCVICGIGGNILCCESCPVVCHHTCIGLTEIPEGDWHCAKCTKASLDKKDGDDTMSGEKCDVDEPIDDSATNTSTLQDLLEELKIRRLGDKGSESKTEPTLASDLEAATNMSRSTTLDAVKKDEDGIKHHLPPLVVGTLFTKEFDAGRFDGAVKQVPDEESRYYKVRYMDGDEEDMSEDELQRCVQLHCERQNEKRRLRSRNRTDIDDNNQPNSFDTPKPMRGRKSSASVKVDPVISEKTPKRRRGRPRNNEARDEEEITTRNNCEPQKTNSTLKRKRGNPRKVEIKEEPEENAMVKKRGRGRPRKNETNIETNVIDRVKKRKRNRYDGSHEEEETEEESIDFKERKKRKKVISPESSDILEIPEICPLPGKVDQDMCFYCANENDTCRTISRKLGCDSWHDIASNEQNRQLYGSALDNVKTRFRKGSLLRIPSGCDSAVVKALIDTTA